MSLFVLGEPAVVEAFSLIGIPGRTPVVDQDLGKVIAELAAREGVRLVLVQQAFHARLSDDQIDQLSRKSSCIVLEIPGLNEPIPDADPFRQYVQRSIGVVA